MTSDDRQPYSLPTVYYPLVPMAITIPPNHLTRPAASKVYNRSKRALERDLEEAYKARDDNVLAAFKLVTNDGTIREATEVTTDLVEKLKMDGKNPTWCVSDAWLESTYGRKGEPKPDQKDEVEEHAAKTGSAAVSDRREEENESDDGSDAGRSKTGDAGSGYLPDDINFLKERIRTLEQEKLAEIQRNEAREAKLFEQLAVKDKQISAWDEVTQGITRGLATGQITALPGGRERQSSSPVTGANVDSKRQSTAADRNETSAVEDGEVVEVKEPTKSKTKQQKSASRKKTTATRKKKSSTKKPQKPKWYEMPTFRRLISR